MTSVTIQCSNSSQAVSEVVSLAGALLSVLVLPAACALPLSSDFSGSAVLLQQTRPETSTPAWCGLRTDII